MIIFVKNYLNRPEYMKNISKPLAQYWIRKPIIFGCSNVKAQLSTGALFAKSRDFKSCAKIVASRLLEWRELYEVILN